MRQKHALIPTLREVKEADTVSHKYLLRAGYIRQLVSGVYSYLPLACIVLKKIEDIVREEMSKINAQELLLPHLHPSELWEETGRYNSYGMELVKLTDRHKRKFVLGPTHEEIITDLLRGEVNSYKKLPMTLYQIQTKFRDEKRPRSGLLRGREFVMKDAYSIHADEASLDSVYKDMYKAYENIFNRCGLEFRVVEADSGAMGGTDTHEFTALSVSGEDTIVTCKSCSYSANIEMAKVAIEDGGINENHVPSLEEIETVNIKTIGELSSFLEVSKDKLVKSLLYVIDHNLVLALVRGNHELSEVKLKNLFNATSCCLAQEDVILDVTGTTPGFVGPIGLSSEITVVADNSLRLRDGLIVGANKKDYHLKNALIGRDYNVSKFEDIRNIEECDKCPECKGDIEFTRGIEVGHIFKLGTRYSEAMNATVVDSDGKYVPYIMGCYGIGISRIIASIVDQHHDANGIVWPKTVSPFDIHLINVSKEDLAEEVSDSLYHKLVNLADISVLYDDRLERPGVKFKDADLIGIPIRVIVGKNSIEGKVEVKYRVSGESEVVLIDELVDYLTPLVKG